MMTILHRIIAVILVSASLVSNEQALFGNFFQGDLIYDFKDKLLLNPNVKLHFFNIGDEESNEDPFQKGNAESNRGIAILGPLIIEKPVNLFFPNNIIPEELGFYVKFRPKLDKSKGTYQSGYLLSVIDPDSETIRFAVKFSVSAVGYTKINEMQIYLNDNIDQKGPMEPIAKITLPTILSIVTEETMTFSFKLTGNTLTAWNGCPDHNTYLSTKKLIRSSSKYQIPHGSAFYLFSGGPSLQETFHGKISSIRLYTQASGIDEYCKTNDIQGSGSEKPVFPNFPENYGNVLITTDFEFSTAMTTTKKRKTKKRKVTVPKLPTSTIQTTRQMPITTKSTIYTIPKTTETTIKVEKITTTDISSTRKLTTAKKPKTTKDKLYSTTELRSFSTTELPITSTGTTETLPSSTSFIKNVSQSTESVTAPTNTIQTERNGIYNSTSLETENTEFSKHLFNATEIIKYGKRDLIADFILNEPTKDGLTVRLVDDEELTVHVKKAVKLARPSILYFENMKFPKEFGFVIEFNPRVKDGYILSLVDPDGKTVRLGFHIQTQSEVMNGNMFKMLKLLIYFNDNMNIVGEDIPKTSIPLSISDVRKTYTYYIFISESQITIWSGCPHDVNQISNIPIKRSHDINMQSGSALYLFSAGEVLKTYYKGAVRQIKMFYTFEDMAMNCKRKVEGSGQSTVKTPDNVTLYPIDPDEESTDEPPGAMDTTLTPIKKETASVFNVLQFFIITNMENVPKSIKLNIHQPDSEETYVEITEPVNIQESAMLIYPNLKFPDEIGIVLDFIPKEGSIITIVDPDLVTIRLGISIKEIKPDKDNDMIGIKKLNIYLQDRNIPLKAENSILASISLPRKLDDLNIKSEFMKLSILISKKKVTVWSKCALDDNILHQQTISRSFNKYNMHPGSLVFLFSSGPILKNYYTGSIKYLKLFNSKAQLLADCNQFEGSGKQAMTPEFGNVLILDTTPASNLSRNLTSKTTVASVSSTNIPTKEMVSSTIHSSTQKYIKTSTISTEPFISIKSSTSSDVPTTTESQIIDFPTSEANPDLLQFLVLESEPKPEGIKINLAQPDMEDTFVSVVSPVNIQAPAQLYFPNSKVPSNIGIVLNFKPNTGILLSVLDHDLSTIKFGLSISETKDILNDEVATNKKLNIFLQDPMIKSSLKNIPIVSMSLPMKGKLVNRDGFMSLVLLISKKNIKIWGNVPTEDNILFEQAINRTTENIILPGSSLFLFSGGPEIKNYYTGSVKKFKLFKSREFLKSEFEIEGSGTRTATPIMGNVLITETPEIIKYVGKETTTTSVSSKIWSQSTISPTNASTSTLHYPITKLDSKINVTDISSTKSHSLPISTESSVDSTKLEIPSSPDTYDFLKEYLVPQSKLPDGIISTTFIQDLEEMKIFINKDILVTKPSTYYFPDNYFPPEFGFNIEFKLSKDKAKSFIFAFLDPDLKTLRLAVQAVRKTTIISGAQIQTLQINIYFDDNDNPGLPNEIPILTETLFNDPSTPKSNYKMSFLFKENNLQVWNGCPFPQNKLQSIQIRRNYKSLHLKIGGVLYLFSGGPQLKDYYQGDIISLKMSKSSADLIRNCRSVETEGSGSTLMPKLEGNFVVSESFTAESTTTMKSVKVTKDITIRETSSKRTEKPESEQSTTTPISTQGLIIRNTTHLEPKMTTSERKPNQTLQLNTSVVIIKTTSTTQNTTRIPESSVTTHIILTNVSEPKLLTTTTQEPNTTLKQIISTSGKSQKSSTYSKSLETTVLEPVVTTTLQPLSSSTSNQIKVTTSDPTITTLSEPIINTTSLKSTVTSSFEPTKSTTLQSTMNTTLEYSKTKLSDSILNTTLDPKPITTLKQKLNTTSDSQMKISLEFSETTSTKSPRTTTAKALKNVTSESLKTASSKQMLTSTSETFIKPIEKLVINTTSMTKSSSKSFINISITVSTSETKKFTPSDQIKTTTKEQKIVTVPEKMMNLTSESAKTTLRDQLSNTTSEKIVTVISDQKFTISPKPVKNNTTESRMILSTEQLKTPISESVITITSQSLPSEPIKITPSSKILNTTLELLKISTSKQNLTTKMLKTIKTTTPEPEMITTTEPVVSTTISKQSIVTMPEKNLTTLSKSVDSTLPITMNTTNLQSVMNTTLEPIKTTTSKQNMTVHLKVTTNVTSDQKGPTTLKPQVTTSLKSTRTISLNENITIIPQPIITHTLKPVYNITSDSIKSASSDQIQITTSKHLITSLKQKIETSSRFINTTSEPVHVTPTDKVLTTIPTKSVTSILKPNVTTTSESMITIPSKSSMITSVKSLITPLADEKMTTSSLYNKTISHLVTNRSTDILKKSTLKPGDFNITTTSIDKIPTYSPATATTEVSDFSTTTSFIPTSEKISPKTQSTSAESKEIYSSSTFSSKSSTKEIVSMSTIKEVTKNDTDSGRHGVDKYKMDKDLKGKTGRPGEKGESGGYGESGQKGKLETCSSLKCISEKGEKGIRGEPGQCPAHLCSSMDGEKGEKGIMGLQGEKGQKGESGILSSEERKRSEGFLRQTVSEYLTSPEINRQYKGEKGEAGQSSKCSCDVKKEILSRMRGAPGKNGKDGLGLERIINYGYGAIIVKSRDELESIGYYLSPGSVVIVLNQENGSQAKKNPTVMIKISDKPNVWRQLNALFGEEQFLSVSNNHKLINKPKPNLEHIVNSPKKLYFILLPEPWRGNIRVNEANHMCQKYASENGYVGLFQAFLENQSRSLKSLLAAKYWISWQIVNKNDETLFFSWNQMFGGYSRRLGVPLLTFEGHDVMDIDPWRSKYMWVGGAVDFTQGSKPSCRDWSSSFPTDLGMTVNLESQLFLNKLTKRSCGNPNYIGCIQISPIDIKI